jgi:tetratricopeptide (TPR) repeat protein
VHVITGRFERNPPLYYEMRLTHSQEQISADPDDLEAYDNAGVACDRLGRDNEAIDWMTRKLERLDYLDAAPGKLKPEHLKEHRYRYLANLGTFWVHRWARDGADRSRIDEVKTARDYIAKAIQLNPNAHFGREKYQLMALNWLIDPPANNDTNEPPTFFNPKDPNTPPAEAVRGLSGLIALGNAWESVDVFNALALALEHDGDRSSVAELARQRAYELIDAGKRSMLPNAQSDPEKLKERVRSTSRFVGDNFIRAEKQLVVAYRDLRTEADAWNKERTEFMLRRLKSGRHPDTDPHFWDGYKPPPPPRMPEIVPQDPGVWAHSLIRWIVAGLLALAGLVVTTIAVANRINKRKSWINLTDPL